MEYNSYGINPLPEILVSGDYNALYYGYKACGVYMASGIYQTERLKAPIYIGSSNNIKDRINKHTRQLKNKDHDNKIIQSYYNDYGSNSLIWFLLERTPPENTKNLENQYFNFYRPFIDECGGFNIEKDANFVIKNPVSIETRKKQAILSVNREKPWFKNKITKEHISVLSEINKKEFAFISPDRKIIKGSNISRFAKELGFRPSAMIGLNTGEKRSYKGWIWCPEKYINLKELTQEEYEDSLDIRGEFSRMYKTSHKRRIKTRSFVSPKGELIKIDNLYRYCLENNLNYQAMSNLFNEKSLNYKGWTKYKL